MRRPIRRRGAPALFAWIAATAAALGGEGPGRPHPTVAFPPTIPPRPGSWVAVPAFPRLTFSVPTFLVAEPRGDRLFVGEREGRILAFPSRRDVESASVFLDLSEHCQGFGDCGL